jgi:nitrile hydratase accessory protein
MTTVAPPLLPGMPQCAGEPVFAAPWQAQAFAMTLALHQQGVFTWTEWAAALSTAIAAAQAAGDADLGDTYYHHWIDALESLVLQRGLGNSAQLHALEHAWEAAAERTPHGQTISLNDTERALAHEA